MHSALTVVVKKSRKKFHNLAAATFETHRKLVADQKSEMKKMAVGKMEKNIGNKIGGRLNITKLAAAQ